MSDLSAHFADIQGQISDRIADLGRARSEVELIVVSKNHPADLVRELYALGQRSFGENRDQEASPKAQATEDLVDVDWHFIGQLQSNKVKSVLGYAKYIHSLDRTTLLSTLGRELEKTGGTVGAFIQLNLTNDPGRGGIQPDDLMPFADAVASMPQIRLMGVMGVAALDRDPRIDFETIAKASQLLQKQHGGANHISAGMSHDWAEALEFGATHLRIGTAITGTRNP